MVRCLSVPVLLLWAKPADDIDRLLQQQQVANAGNATLSEYIDSSTLRLVGLALGQTLVRETCHFSNIR